MQRLKALENIVQSLIPQQDLSLQALETRVQLLSLSETNSNTPGDLDNSSNSQVSVANSFSRPGSARTSMQAENMDNMDNVNNVLQGTDVGTPVMVAKDEKTHYEGVGSTGGFLARLDQIIRGGSINDNGNKDVIEVCPVPFLLIYKFYLLIFNIFKSRTRISVKNQSINQAQ